MRLTAVFVMAVLLLIGQCQMQDDISAMRNTRHKADKAVVQEVCDANAACPLEPTDEAPPWPRTSP